MNRLEFLKECTEIIHMCEELDIEYDFWLVKINNGSIEVFFEKNRNPVENLTYKNWGTVEADLKRIKESLQKKQGYNKQL